MISPVPQAPDGRKLLRLYVELAADDPSTAGDAVADSNGGELEVRHVRRALEWLDTLRRSSGQEADVDAPACDDNIARIGNYEVLREIGRGGWGIVYEAVDLRTGTAVALKLPLLEFAGHPQFGRRFVREAKLLESLDHPNLIKVYETGQAGWIWYLALEYCQGPNLKQWLAHEGGRVGERQTAALVAAVADGLDHVHQQGILHRDIKPTNILLDARHRPDGAGDSDLSGDELPFVPRLVDFGLAKLATASGDTTRDGMLIGTPAYMSPEQALGRQDEITPASDTFALGIILFEILIGRHPFGGDDELEIRYRVAKKPTPSLADTSFTVSPAMKAICHKALAKQVGERYGTARELADDLRRLLRGEKVHAPAAPELAPQRSRRAALAAAVLGLGGAAAFWFGRAATPAPQGFEPRAVPFRPDARLLGDWLFHRSELDGRRVRDRTGRLDGVIQGEYDFLPAGKLEALQFDGRTTLVYLGRSSENLPVPQESMTAEVWVRIDAPMSWGSLIGLFQDNGPDEDGWCLGYFNDKLAFSLKASGKQNWMIHLVDTVPFEPGAWYHVAGTYDGAVQRLYVNGQMLGESHYERGPISYPTWNYYELGCYHDVDEFRAMKGCLHEARVYQAALSGAEIAQRFAERRDLLPNIESPRRRQARVWTSFMRIIDPFPGGRPAAP